MSASTSMASGGKVGSRLGGTTSSIRTSGASSEAEVVCSTDSGRLDVLVPSVSSITPDVIGETPSDCPPKLVREMGSRRRASGTRRSVSSSLIRPKKPASEPENCWTWASRPPSLAPNKTARSDSRVRTATFSSSAVSLASDSTRRMKSLKICNENVYHSLDESRGGPTRTRARFGLGSSIALSTSPSASTSWSSSSDSLLPQPLVRSVPLL